VDGGRTVWPFMYRASGTWSALLMFCHCFSFGSWADRIRGSRNGADAGMRGCEGVYCRYARRCGGEGGASGSAKVRTPPPVIAVAGQDLEC